MASGQTLGTFQAIDAFSSVTNGTIPKVTNNRMVQQFDPSTQQSCEFSWVVPRNYSAATGWTIILQWFGDTATTNNVLWGVAVERNASAGNAVTTDNFASTVNASAAVAVQGTLGKLTYTSIALTNGTQINSVAVGEECRVKILRIAADASDTMAGFANLLSFEIEET